MIYVWGCGVVVACLIFTGAIGVRIPVEEVKFHNDSHNTILWHHWQLSETHMPQVHPSNAREIGNLKTVFKPLGG